MIAMNRLGFYEAQEAALAGTGGGMLLEGLHPATPYPGVSYRPSLEWVADVGDFGFIVFAVDEAAGLVRVFDLVWTG